MKQILILMAVIAFSSCSRHTYEGLRWQSKPVVVDGNINDWKLPLQYYDGNSKLNYEFSNDNENLYFAIRTSDMNIQRQIMSKGILIEMDTVKSKYYAFAIQYPVSSEFKQDPGMGRPPEQFDNHSMDEKRNESVDGVMENPDDEQFSRKEPPGKSESVNNDRPDFQEDALIRGFNGYTDEEVILFQDELKGIVVRMNNGRDNILQIEGKIPFQSIIGRTISGSDTLYPFFIKITLEKDGMPLTNHATTPQRRDNEFSNMGGRSGGNPPSGGPPAGRGGEGGMGNSPGGGPGGRPGDMNMMQQNENKDNEKEYKMEIQCHFTIQDAS